MKIVFKNDTNSLNVDLSNEIIIYKGDSFEQKVDMSEFCDCVSTPVKIGAILPISKLTWWNLLFDKETKNALKTLKNEI